MLKRKIKEKMKEINERKMRKEGKRGNEAKEK